MWCVEMVRELISSDAAAREEKSITEVSRDIIPAIDFLDALKRKRKKGLLSIEFKVSATFVRNLITRYWSFFPNKLVFVSSVFIFLPLLQSNGGSKKGAQRMHASLLVHFFHFHADFRKMFKNMLAAHFLAGASRLENTVSATARRNITARSI